jgi:hypothetical protein
MGLSRDDIDALRREGVLATEEDMGPKGPPQTKRSTET